MTTDPRLNGLRLAMEWHRAGAPVSLVLDTADRFARFLMGLYRPTPAPPNVGHYASIAEAHDPQRSSVPQEG